MRIKTDIKLFLEDENAFSLILEECLYQKITKENKVFIYVSKKFSQFSDISLMFLGIYSLNLQKFIFLSDEYEVRYLFYTLEDLNDYLEEYSETAWYNKLNQLVIIEATSMLNTTTNNKSTYDDEIKQLAINHYKDGTEPIFDYNLLKINLDMDNIIDCLDDVHDFVYQFVYDLILNNRELIEEYQKVMDILSEIENLKKSTPFELKLDTALSQFKKEGEKKYKNIYLVLDKNGVEEKTESIPFSNINMYPSYAIKKVYWGRTVIYDIDNLSYTTQEYSDLRKNVKYNIELLANKNLDLDYVEISLFENLDFVIALINMSKKHNVFDISCDYYSHINKKFIENVSFLKSNQSNININALMSIIDSSFVLNNKNFFLNFLDGCHFYYVSDDIKKDLDFYLLYLEQDVYEALKLLDDTLASFDEVQTKIDTIFAKILVNYTNSNMANLPISKFKSRETRLNVLNASNFVNLSDDDKDDFNFVMDFITKSKNRVSGIVFDYFGFRLIYNNLGPSLKTNKTICLELLSISKISNTEWEELDDIFKSDDDIQVIVAKNNYNLLLELDYKNIEKVVLSDPLSLKAYKEKKKDIPEDLAKKVAQISIKDISKLKGLSYLSYNQTCKKSLMLELVKIQPLAYEYCSYDLKKDYDIAYAVTEKISIIKLLPEKSKWNTSFWDNKEIMLRSIKHNPDDFGYIPQTDRKHGPAPLMDDDSFIFEAIKLSAYNIVYLRKDSKYRSNTDIAMFVLLDDTDYFGNFDRKIFKDENFVYSFINAYLKQCNYRELFINYLKNSELFAAIPKYIKESTKFKQTFPSIC